MTGVQTCALPISNRSLMGRLRVGHKPDPTDLWTAPNTMMLCSDVCDMLDVNALLMLLYCDMFAILDKMR